MWMVTHSTMRSSFGLGWIRELKSLVDWRGVSSKVDAGPHLMGKLAGRSVVMLVVEFSGIVVWNEFVWQCGCR
jgi:hypothetical protein